jgi:uncharacterized membrane protein YbhN (UPF0104 family)
LRVSTPAPPDLRGRGARIAGIAISLVSLAAVVVWASRQQPPELPSSMGQLAALGGAVGVYGAATVLRGERWYWMLRQAGEHTRRADAYGLVTVGYMGNNVLPARGGDAMRTYLCPRGKEAGIRHVVGTLVAERVLDAAFLLSLFVVLAYGVLRGIDAPDSDRLLLVVAAGAVAAVVTWLLLRLGRRHPRGRSAIEFLAPMAKATRDLRGGYGLAMVGMTAAIWVTEAATYYAVGLAASVPMTPIEALYVVALASVFILIPSGPGYVGTLDAAVLFGVRAVGGTGSEAVSYLLLLRLVLLVPITVAGLVLLVARYGGFGSARAARVEASGA